MLSIEMGILSTRGPFADASLAVEGSARLTFWWISLDTFVILGHVSIRTLLFPCSDTLSASEHESAGALWLVGGFASPIDHFHFTRAAHTDTDAFTGLEPGTIGTNGRLGEYTVAVLIEDSFWWANWPLTGDTVFAVKCRAFVAAWRRVADAITTLGDPFIATANVLPDTVCTIPLSAFTAGWSTVTNTLVPLNPGTLGTSWRLA